MASDSDKSSSNHNLDGSLKINKNQGNTGNIGKDNLNPLIRPFLTFIA